MQRCKAQRRVKAMSAIVESSEVLLRRDAAAPRGAVSWGAVFAGAAAAGALSLILLLLGTGLGLSSVSPWATEGIDASTFGVSSILWITFMQLAASALGGYLAGRLRTKWVAVHTDEVYFRDTAHGFLAWAVATLGTAALLTSVVGSIVSGGVQAGATVAGTATTTAMGGAAAIGSASTEQGAGDESIRYFVDSLFRPDAAAGGRADRVDERPEQTATALGEVARIFANGVRTGALPDDDVRYVGQVVAERTDITQQEAERRVRDVFARVQTTLDEAETAAREAADAAREASAYAALWLFISLLIGAFVASWMATFGGRQRDL
jgi:hypothetical protein